MTDNVVSLPPREKRPRKVWVCACGCRSMNLLADGNAECAACDAVVADDRGGWQERIADAGEYEGKVTPYEAVNFGEGQQAEEFARRRVLGRAQEEGVAAVVVVHGDGVISTWTHISDQAQYKWLKERMAAAWRLMKPGGPGA